MANVLQMAIVQAIQQLHAAGWSRLRILRAAFNLPDDRLAMIAPKNGPWLPSIWILVCSLDAELFCKQFSEHLGKINLLLAEFEFFRRFMRSVCCHA